MAERARERKRSPRRATADVGARRPFATQERPENARGDRGWDRAGRRGGRNGGAALIGIDTNVLLRAFVNDHPEQAERARKFIGSRTASDPAFVCLVTLVEFAWSLRTTFGYSPAILAQVPPDQQ